MDYQAAHNLNEALTKPTVGSISISSGGAIIERYGGITDAWLNFFNEWAIAIGAIFTILLGIAKLVLMFYELRCKIREDDRAEIEFEERRKGVSPDTGHRDRKTDK